MNLSKKIIWYLLVFLFLHLLLYSNSCYSKNKQNISNNDSIAKIIYAKAKTFYKQNRFDSAYSYYSKALHFYKRSNDSTNIAKTLLKLSVVDFKNKDYLSCDNNCINSLKYISNQNGIKQNLSVYNLLGLSSEALTKYQEASKYFETYRTIYQTMPSKDTLNYFISYQNNMGLVYQKSENYTKAIHCFDQILALENIKIKKPKKYARALDNKAWSLFLNTNKKEALPLIIEASDLRKTNDDKAGLLMSLLHLSEYYFAINKKEKGKIMAKNALQLSKDIHNPDGKLEALYLLAKLDEKQAISFFTQHKELQDSLIKRERKFKDQTAKIRYKTSQKEKQITAQQILIQKRDKTLVWGTFLFFLTLLSALLFLLQKQKIKTQNKILAQKNTDIRILQKELHHRVKGNLSIINTFIDVAKEKFNNEKFLSKLNELQNRILSISEAHRQLYNNNDVTQLKIGEYIKNIVQNVQSTFNNTNIEIQQNIDSNLSMQAKNSFLVGLIINEFLTNSFKYAFEPTQQGITQINITEIESSYQLNLSDNGKGLPKDFDIDKTESFGMRVMKLLSQQLEGTFSIKNKDGIHVKIVFPKQI